MPTPNPRLHIACSATSPPTPTTARRLLLSLLRQRRLPGEATMRLLCYHSFDTDDHPTRQPCPRRLHTACSATSPPTTKATRGGCYAPADSPSPALLPLLRHRRPPDAATVPPPTPHRLRRGFYSHADAMSSTLLQLPRHRCTPPTPNTARRGYHAHADATSPALVPPLRHRRPPD